MRVLRSVVGRSLAKMKFGINYVVDALSEGDKIWQLYRQGLVMYYHPHWNSWVKGSHYGAKRVKGVKICNAFLMRRLVDGDEIWHG